MRDTLEKLGPTALLAAPAVLDDLRMSDEQIAQVQATQESFHVKRQEAFIQAMQSGVGHRREEAARIQRQAAANAGRPLNQQLAEALVQLLDADQRRRLWQIGLLVEGPLVLAWPCPPPPDTLEVTPSQLAQIRHVRDKFAATKRDYEVARNEITLVPQGDGFRVYLSTEALRQKIKVRGFAWMVDQVDAARDRANAQVAALLTADQRQKLDTQRLIAYDVSDLIRPGGGKWRPEEAKQYWEERKDRKAQEQAKPGEND
jgi:hypothetical protein